ncbi:MAG: undecaprenyl-diphosphate phosphatase [Candidatus Thorarchaeota archaeon]|jgi:undecaprenyl-diphosphatase
MEVWQIIVSLIQGLVEWLPISSEGQAVLFAYNLSTVPPGALITLVVWLHLGTALVVLVRYPRTIIDVILLRDRVLFRQLLIATTFTAVSAIPLYIFIKNSITSFQGEFVNILVGVLLLVTAGFLYLPTRKSFNDTEDVGQQLSDKEVAITGLVQGLAVLPGLSRSGVTVSALLMQKIDKETALRFSFLMSVPAVLGILAVEILSGGVGVPTIGTFDLIVMELIVFVSGLVSMELLLRLARRVRFWKLCIVLGAIAIIFGLFAFL